MYTSVRIYLTSLRLRTFNMPTCATERKFPQKQILIETGVRRYTIPMDHSLRCTSREWGRCSDWDPARPAARVRGIQREFHVRCQPAAKTHHTHVCASPGASLREARTLRVCETVSARCGGGGPPRVVCVLFLASPAAFVVAAPGSYVYVTEQITSTPT